MRKFLSIGVIFALVAPACFAMNMSLSSTCGFDTKYLQVGIWTGGYAEVNSDKTIAFPFVIPEGTLLAASVNSSYCDDRCSGGQRDCVEQCEKDVSRKLFGDWAPAKNNSVLPVLCNFQGKITKFKKHPTNK